MKRILYGEEFDVIDLSKEGNNGLIFDLVSSIQFMFLAVKNGDRILGGDILIKNKYGSYDESCDNWYSNSDKPEETLRCALSYLKQYLQYEPMTDWRVSVVVSNLSKFD